jgi:GNAT superfamily N-acetyltransferase
VSGPRTGVLVVRPFEERDEAAVVALWRRCGLVTPWNDPHADVERKLRVQRELFLVGHVGGELIASVMAGFDGHRGWLNYLAVDPRYRRRGYGRRLVMWAEDALHRRGCPKVNVQVRAGNREALGFYQRCGFTVDEVVCLGRRFAAGGPEERATAPRADAASSRYAVITARPCDLEALPPIERAAAAQFPPRLLPFDPHDGVVPDERLEAARAEGRLWVALDERGVPVGFAMADHAEHSGFLAEVDVHPDHQRQGIGRALIGAAADWAIAAGHGRLTLTTFDEVPWNAPYYERLGFRRLMPEELDDWLARRLADERRLGLRGRVAMALELRASGGA